MAISISKALNIEKEEKGIVYLLLLQSVFLGIFAGALDVGANALFLEAYSADLMPRAFMLSGAVGIIFTSIYTYLQKRLQFKLFTVLNLLFVTVVTALLRLGYFLFDDPRLAFALMVMMGPLIIISLLGFWGTAGRYFSLREGKRLFGIIDTGSIIGMILAFYAVPLMMRFDFKVHDTLLIGLVSIIISLVFQLLLLGRHSLKVNILIRESRKQKRGGLIKILSNRYTALMAIFIVFSVIVGFFIHYSFMWVSETQYPVNKELTSFIGAFFGTMMIATVLFKSTLYSWLMKNYGLQLTLLISPALLLILTIVASLVGGISGYGPEATGFTFFFLLLSLSKLFNKSLKDSIESPSMKILYQSLDSSVRFDIQASIDGVVNEITAFITGLVMAGLLLLDFVSVIHFSYLLIIVLAIWFVLGIRLYSAYRKTLNDSLASVVDDKKQDELESETESRLDELPLLVEKIQVDPYFYKHISEGEIDSLLLSEDPVKRFASWKFFARTMYSAGEEICAKAKKNADPALLLIIAEYEKRYKLPGKKIDDFFRSREGDKVMAALSQTIRDNDKRQVPHLISLLRDKDMLVRAAAIETAGKIKSGELGPYLVEYLGHPQLYAITWKALVEMGEPILGNLENYFHKSGVPLLVQLRIVNAMSTIGGSKACEYLFQKLDYHQREVQEAAAIGLYINDYQPDEREMVFLRSRIYEVAKAGVETMTADYVIRSNKENSKLIQALEEELKRINELLFKLLCLGYETSAVEHVQRSFEDPDHTDTGYALELLNLIVDDEVFSYLEAYFDDISVVEKVRRLQNEMPLELMTYQRVLLDILGKDGLYAGSYTRLCAIDEIRNTEGMEAGEYLAAQVFHPDNTISTAALSALSTQDKALAEDVEMRHIVHKHAEKYGNFFGSKGERDDLLEIVEDLKTWPIFSAIDRERLYRLVRLFVRKEEILLEDPTLLSVFRISDSEEENLKNGLFINLGGHSELFNQMKYIASLPGIQLYQLKRDDLKELLFDFPEIRQVILDIINTKQLKLNQIKGEVL